MMKLKGKYLLTSIFILISLCVCAQPDMPGPAESPVPVETGIVLLGGALLFIAVRKLKRK